jgi:hypothetical protein
VTWQKTFGGRNPGHQDSARAIQQTQGGDYVVAGETGSFGGAWVLRLNAHGDFCDGCLLGDSTDAVPADCNALAADTTATAADGTLLVLDSGATVEDADFAPDPICVCSPRICTHR